MRSNASQVLQRLLTSHQLLLFTTPFGMVLQYFGSEKDIFSFTRNPKSFVVATLILMLVLRILTLLLEHAEFLLRLFTWKKSPARSSQQRPSSEDQGEFRARNQFHEADIFRGCRT